MSERSREQEPLPAIRMTHYATATALEALEKEREARWTAQHAADEERGELCENCTAALDSAAERIDGSWLCVDCWPEAAAEAVEVVAIAAYEESVQQRLSDLRHEGTWWAYGAVPDEGGWGCWLECTIGRESDTRVWLSEPEWSSFTGAADEAAARTEATRRNRGGVEMAGNERIVIPRERVIYTYDDHTDILNVYAALAQLLLDHKMHVYTGSRPDGKTLCAEVDCSDIFAWGCSDSEGVTEGELRDLYEMHMADKTWGTVKWCVKKREEFPQAPVLRAMKDAGAWDLDESQLKPNFYDAVSAKQAEARRQRAMEKQQS